MPEYVARDLIYKNSKNDPSTVKGIWARYYGNMQWKLADQFPVSESVWDSDTLHDLQRNMSSYGDNSPEREWHPKQAARFDLQRQQVQQQGVSQEPIIVELSRQEPGKYSLLEGWHRTTETMKAYPDGYTVPAYIGSPTGQSEQVRQTRPDSFWSKIKKLFK